MTTNSSDTTIVVLESNPYWGPELQRQFEQTHVAVRECRSVRDLFPAVDGFASALIVIDLESALVEVLEWLASEVPKHMNRVPTIVCGSANTFELEWQLREAGVTAFLPDRISGDDLARLCRRQLGSTNKSRS